MLPGNDDRVGSFLVTGAVSAISEMVVGRMLLGRTPARACATPRRPLRLAMPVGSPNQSEWHDTCATRRHSRVGLTCPTRQQIVDGIAVYVNTVTLPVAASIPVVTAGAYRKPLPQREERTNEHRISY